MRNSFGKRLVAIIALAMPLGLALADSPEPKKAPEPKKTPAIARPNLSAAQKLAAQAFDKLEAAQKADEYDRGGHAAKAKALLKQANEELELAWSKVERGKVEKR